MVSQQRKGKVSTEAIVGLALSILAGVAFLSVWSGALL